MDAALADFEDEKVKESQKPKASKPKEYGQMWQDLAYLEEQQDKIEAQENNFIPKEEKPKPKEVVTDKEIEEKLDVNFDDDSLTVYGAMLSDTMDQAKPGKETATLTKAVGEILNQEQIKKKKQREEKARKLLEDIPMNDDQIKQSMIEEWSSYTQKKTN